MPELLPPPPRPASQAPESAGLALGALALIAAGVVVIVTGVVIALVLEPRYCGLTNPYDLSSETVCAGYASWIRVAVAGIGTALGLGLIGLSLAQNKGGQ